MLVFLRSPKLFQLILIPQGLLTFSKLSHFALIHDRVGFLDLTVLW